MQQSEHVSDDHLIPTQQGGKVLGFSKPSPAASRWSLHSFHALPYVQPPHGAEPGMDDILRLGGKMFEAGSYSQVRHDVSLHIIEFKLNDESGKQMNIDSPILQQ